MQECTFRYPDDAQCVYQGREVEDNREEHGLAMCDSHRIITITRARYTRNKNAEKARRRAS